MKQDAFFRRQSGLGKSRAIAKSVPRRVFAIDKTNSLSLWKVNLAISGLGFPSEALGLPTQ